MKISDLHPSVRPYERLEQYGAEALSDEELVAIVIRNGTKGKSSKEIASKLLSSPDIPEGLPGLYRLSLEELALQEGIGRVKAIVLKACLEIGRRCLFSGSGEQVRFLSEEIARQFFEEKMAFLETEEVHAAFIDSQKRLIKHEVVCKGSINGVGLSMREVFRTAVRVNASGLILAHNHPSGEVEPSIEDIAATKLLQNNGKMIGVDVIDHIIVGRGTSVSLLSQGLMEEN
ncbi:MAG: DNA repair protein RadC [Clostridiales bacterium]|nr:DNA repair protein RadC [Clostridiales bacterium]